MSQIEFLNEEDLPYKYQIGSKIKFMGEKAVIVSRDRFLNNEREPNTGGINYILYFDNLKDYYRFSEKDLDKYGSLINRKE